MDNNKTIPCYEYTDCIKLIHDKYPFIPRFVINRVLYGEELYMQKLGIIHYIPRLFKLSYFKQK